MQEYGITLVENVPTDLSGLPQLVKTIFGPEPNHYGDYFKVETKPDANNIAYTGAKIGLHQDLPYYEKTPSVIVKFKMKYDLIELKLISLILDTISSLHQTV